MKLLIVSQVSTQEYDIDWLEINTPCGSMIIQHGHAPLIATLVANKELSFYATISGKKIIQLTRPGFLEVDKQGITALISE
jgi:F0F1-type ATP synthase epsilon subunit